MAKTKRISMTIPTELSVQLDRLSTALKVSRSSLITEMLSENVSTLIEVLNLSISSAELSSKDAPTLSRNPDKVRSYLDSLKSAIDSKKSLLDAEYTDLVSQLEGARNDH